LWERVAPVLPRVERRFRYPGRLRIDDRRRLQGILWVLFSGLPWRAVPAEFGVSGVTCRRRLEAWQRSGVWERLLVALRLELERAGGFDEARLLVDSSIAPAKKGARRLGEARWIAAARPVSGT
jgi:transposase